MKSCVRYRCFCAEHHRTSGSPALHRCLGSDRTGTVGVIRSGRTLPLSLTVFEHHGEFFSNCDFLFGAGEAPDSSRKKGN